MNKKSKPQETDTKLKRDLATFEQLPEKTKELMKLKERDERTGGPEHVVIAKQMDDA